MAVRAFRHIRVDLILQHVVKMAKGLLLGQNRNVETVRVIDERLNFLRRQCGFFRRDQRLAGEIENMLHV